MRITVIKAGTQKRELIVGLSAFEDTKPIKNLKILPNSIFLFQQFCKIRSKYSLDYICINTIYCSYHINYCSLFLLE